MLEYNMSEVLSKAAKITPNRNESALSFSKRIVKALADENFPEDEWDALPDDAQTWVNEQIRATNERKEIVILADYEEFNGPIQRDTRFKATQQGVRRNTEVSREKGVNAMTLIRKMLLDDIHLTPKQIEILLQEQGFTLSRLTVTSIKADFKSMIKFLQDHKMLVRDLL
jgi:hypothetical protein